MGAPDNRSIIEAIVNELETRLPAHSAHCAVNGGRKPFLIAIDGRCGSGKTTLADALSKAVEARFGISCPVLRMDDFYLRPEQRTRERYLEPGGNVDRERFLSEVLRPLAAGEEFEYLPLECPALTLGAPKRFAPSPAAIIEGSYSLHPELRPYYGLCVFMSVSKAVQRERLLRREGEEGLERFEARWISLEESYFEGLKPDRYADIVAMDGVITFHYGRNNMSLIKTPLEAGRLKLNNRLAMPPMASAKADADGRVTDELIRYYCERTRGGHIGLVIVEHAFVSPEGMANFNQLSIADDGVIPGLARLAGAVHKDGGRLFAQLNHAGSAARIEATGTAAISASEVQLRPDRAAPRAMTEEDIGEVKAAFVSAALRAKEAGLDGVELHSAHGYLLNQFYSPLTNRRADRYGGCLENRIRFHLELIEAVRAAVGPDYPIAIRLGANDHTEGGSTDEDAVNASIAFEKAGIDLIDVSGGFCGYVLPGRSDEGYFGGTTLRIKERVSVPVLLTGGVVTPEGAERLLREGRADIIGVGRALLKDPAWAARCMETLP